MSQEKSNEVLPKRRGRPPRLPRAQAFAATEQSPAASEPSEPSEPIELRSIADLDAGERLQMRCKYVIGEKTRDIAEYFGVKEQAVLSLAKRENWAADLIALQCRVEEKLVPGLETAKDLESKMAALEDEAERRMLIVRRHRTEWLQYEDDILGPAKEAKEEKQARTAKLLGEAIRVKQQGERAAWGMDGGLELASNGPLIVRWGTPAQTPLG